jgi:hypothetical protein
VGAFVDELGAVVLVGALLEELGADTEVDGCVVFGGSAALGGPWHADSKTAATPRTAADRRACLIVVTPLWSM